MSHTQNNQQPAANCCSPSRKTPEEPLLPESLAAGVGGDTLPHGETHIPAGSFMMGDSYGEGYPADGEVPVHEVELKAFQMDTTAVTNRQFAAFVDATGYRTEAEKYGTSAVFRLVVQAEGKDILGVAAGSPWWLNVKGADWAHPAGPGQHWSEIPDHPVVQVSHDDALAYCQWAGRRLPTEAEWEYAARGGLEQQRYPWGDELLAADGEHNCNIWQGTFPEVNTRADGYLATAPVRSFPPNGYGLYEVSGNVWEWCSDWFLPKYYRNSPATDPQGPTIGMGRVMRGGSYLCHHTYCNRYRVAARNSNSPDSSSSNCGFRTAAD